MPQTDAQNKLDRKARKLVEREVFLCLSYLVSHIQELDPEDEALMELHAETWADRLYALEQYNVTCEQEEGEWTVRAQSPDGPVQFTRRDREDAIDEVYYACGWPDAYPEIFEYWAVSNYLADKLEERGAHVCRDFYSVTVWGRETTGQAIAMDGIIRDIANELGDAWAE